MSERNCTEEATFVLEFTLIIWHVQKLFSSVRSSQSNVTWQGVSICFGQYPQKCALSDKWKAFTRLHLEVFAVQICMTFATISYVITAISCIHCYENLRHKRLPCTFSISRPCSNKLILLSPNKPSTRIPLIYTLLLILQHTIHPRP